MAGFGVCSALFDPDHRLATFPDEWPHSEGNLSPQVMAENGFYFTGADGDDEVQCFACGKVLDGWEPKDDVFQEHQRRNECFFLSFLRDKGDPRKLNLKVALQILCRVYERKLQALQGETLENHDIINALCKNRKK